MIEHEDFQLAKVQGRAPVRVYGGDIYPILWGQSNLDLGVMTHRTQTKIVEYYIYKPYNYRFIVATARYCSYFQQDGKVKDSKTGWWFGTFFIFHILIGNDHPNWRTHIFQRARSTTNQMMIYIPIKSYISLYIPMISPWYSRDVWSNPHNLQSDPQL